jgi:uncharacterized protein with von Willebrand factor type A (vWA) domain
MNTVVDTPAAGVGPARFSAKSIVEFCRFARVNGVSAGVSETIDAVRATEAVGGGDETAVRFALRAILCSSPEDWSQFEALFTAYWRTPDSRPENQSKNPTHRPIASLRTEREKKSVVLADFGDPSDKETERKGKSFSGASTVQRLRKVDFSEIQQTDLAELERLAVRLLRQMSHRVAKRLRPRKFRYSIDLRRTIRRSICRGGELIDLRYKGPKKERAKLVILLDVSDSMNAYSFFLLKFAYALGRHSKDVRSFVFSTGLVEVSEMLRTRRISDALETVSKMTTGWSGGTRIGGSLREFNQWYAPGLLSRHTIFIILSDGWDTGAPEDLAAELKKIRSRVSKLIWLNPLLGLEDYQPATRGIQSALPYIDVFAAAHNLQSLLALEGHLRSTMTR